MIKPDVGSLFLTFDPLGPAMYVYLRDRKGYRVARSVRIAPGVVADLDAKGKLMGVELLDPKGLGMLFTKVVSRYGATELLSLKPRRRAIEALLQPTA